jgi:hypothetical protein
MNSKNKNIRDLYRGINAFERGYQPRSNLVKDEIGDLLADLHSIINRSKNYFSQLLNVNSVTDVRQIEVHTAEPLGPGSSRLEAEIAITKFKKDKSPSSHQKVKHNCLRSINSFILFEIRRNCLINERSLLLYQFTKRAINVTVVMIMGYHCYHICTEFFPLSFSRG